MPREAKRPDAPKTPPGVPPQSWLRRWTEAVYSFDDRLWERWISFLKSPGGILLQFFVIWLSVFTLFALIMVQFPRVQRSMLILCGIAAVGALAHYSVTRRAMTARQRDLRHAAGQCVECGYDLRASKRRCPECGVQNQRRHRPRSS